MSSVSAEEQGMKHLKAANRAGRINVLRLRFSPDFEEAALEYEAAAQYFTSSGLHEKATDALRQLADIRRKERDWFGAGRAYESAASSYQIHLNNYKEGCKVLEQAADCYALGGKIDSSCRVWLKIAEIRENQLNDHLEAGTAYRKCIELYNIGDREQSMADTFKSYIGCLARHLRADEKTISPLLISALDQQMTLQSKLKQNSSFQKACLCKIILRLYHNDVVSAYRDLEVAATASSLLLTSDEYQLARELLKAWESSDTKRCDQLLGSSMVTYLPLEFVKLALTLRLPENPSNRLASMPQATVRFGTSDPENSGRGMQEAEDIGESLR